MAELADALDLGSSPLCGIGVQVPSLAPVLKKSFVNISMKKEILS